MIGRPEPAQPTGAVGREELRPVRPGPEAVRLDPPAAACSSLHQLQRTAGNRAVTQLVQGLSSPGDGPPVVQRDYAKPGRLGGVFESEQFGGDASKRERVTFVELPVHITNTSGRSAAPPPLSQYAHGGKVNVSGTERKPGFDGGHVVGLQLGGEDVPENVVPMYKAFNRGAYKNMEDEVRRQAAAITNPWITIHCHYADPESDTPYAFEVLLESDAAGVRTAVWTTFLRQPEDIKLVSPLDEAEQKIVRGEVNADDVRKVAGTALKDSASFFVLPGGTTVEKYIQDNKNLPPTTNGMYPDNPALRRYQFLDMLYYAGRLSTGEMGAHRDFSGAQRNLILQANMARNGGRIISDDAADPVPGGLLSEQGDVNFPEIDHIVPKSRGGSNLFSNARVVSWQLNNVEDRVKSLFAVIDMTKRPLPNLSGMGREQMKILVENYVYRVQPSDEFAPRDVWSWGTANFTVMNGQIATDRRLGLVNAALLDLVKGNVVVQSSGRYRFVKQS